MEIAILRPLHTEIFFNDRWHILAIIGNGAESIAICKLNNYRKIPIGSQLEHPSWWNLSAHGGKSFYDPCPPGWQVTPQGFIDIVCQGHTYISTPFYTGTEATDNYEILKENKNNSFLWYSSNYMIFNYIYDYYDFEAERLLITENISSM